MSIIQACSDTKDCVDLFRPQGLYLKPIAKINVSVQLPQLKKAGAKISNWEVMEKVKEMARPFTFPVFKVSKSSLEFIRFESEIENYSSMENVLAKLDMKTIKLSGFTELLKVRAAEAKTPFPTRADWDSFFRENKNMNEMKAGERPDTIHFENMPCKWFVNYQDKSGVAHDKPSEFVLKKAFQAFGDIKIVDIPMLDPYRHKMKKTLSGISTFSFGQDLVFEAYIQYKEYIGFVKAMNALKGMKLCYKDRESERAWTSNIKTDFDKTKHLAETTIKQRKAERERIVKDERDKEKQENNKKRLEEMQKNEQLKVMAQEDREREEKKMAKALVASQRRMAREEKRKAKTLHKMGLTEEEEMAERIGIEERKLLLAQRKLESIRILDELLERVKATNKTKNEIKSLGKVILEAARRDAAGPSRGRKDSDNLKDKEREIREKLVLKLKRKAEGDVEHHQGKISKVKTDGLESVSDEDLSGTLDDVSVEEVSEEEMEDDDNSDSEEDKISEIDSEEELRLTSTDDDSEKESKRKKKKKKDKKEKKKKGKDREKDSDRESRKERELRRQIHLAERIASRRSPVRREARADLWEHEKYDRARGKGRRERTPTGYYGAKDYYERRRRSVEREEREAAPMDEFERDEYERKKFMNSAKLKKVNRFLTQSGMRKEQVEKEMERAYEKYFSSLGRKNAGRGAFAGPKSEEQAKEEQWERMTNPHLFGGSGGGGFRKVKVGQHYEEVQKEVLQHEIRIRERRENSQRERGTKRRDERRERW
eukprot:GFUD01034098.1.p1 GENE.GFUD01034098.1~~GFUD01034098.1.p1  ORF type:complete len:770 (-),score=299.84 GFUD01034098.1:76-2385(-)